MFPLLTMTATTNHYPGLVTDIMFPKDEELIYEGDVDDDVNQTETDANNDEDKHDEIDDRNQVEMDIDEEDKDKLIVDFTAGELELDPIPSEEKKNVPEPTSSGDKADSMKHDATCKVDSEEERFVYVFC